MNLNYLRFRAGEAITPQLVGQRLTYLERLRAGQGAPFDKRVREKDPQAGAGKIILLRKRQPLDLTSIPASLPTDIKALHTALSLQAELGKAKWCLLNNKTILMRGEVTVRLFKLAMDGFDFRFTGLLYLAGQIDSPKDSGQPVRQVTIELAREFLTRLNGLTGRQFRLPTNDEYQRACYGEIDGKRVLSGDLWTPCTTEKDGEIIWRLANGHSSPPGDSLDTFKGIRIVEQLPV